VAGHAFLLSAAHPEIALDSNLLLIVSGRVLIVVDKYPCLSESFIRNDLAELERRGFAVAVVACCPAKHCDTWISSELQAKVLRARECLRTIPPSKRLEPFINAISDLGVSAAFFDGHMRSLRGTLRTAWTASAVTPIVAKWSPEWVHAQFLGIPAVVGDLLARRLGLPFSISAHARDIFVPTVRLDRLCSRAKFIAACSVQAQASLIGRLPSHLADRVFYCPHTIGWPPLQRRSSNDCAMPLLFLSVARLVPKKGLDTVLEALALVREQIDFRFRIVGEGPELHRLQRLASRLGLDCVEFNGRASPADVSEHLAEANLFLLGTRTAADGDRDGIPNAVLEAMAARVPVVATDGGAISEVLRHRCTGWLSPPDDHRALADCIYEAATHRALRDEIIEAAWSEIRRRFPSDNPHLLADRIKCAIIESHQG